MDHQPYMYDSEFRDARSPEKEFDPKAYTRASWEVKPKKPKPTGPLVSFNQHPDSHVVLTGRTYDFRPMSDTSKWWIRWTRYVQVALRVVQMVVSAGLIVLMVLISNVPQLISWILRISSGVIIACCGYAIFHLSRPARARPPASSAAYQLFAGLTDLAIMPFYAFGAMMTLKQSDGWSTILPDKSLVPLLIEIEWISLFGAIGLHAFSLGISIYLGVMFKRIADMPPDMNPLESNLTSRRKHKRNKSSVGSDYTAITESEKRHSMAHGGQRASGSAYEEYRPKSIPFMETRARSREPASKRDSRVELPSRQYESTPGSSPRNSHFPVEQVRRSNVRFSQGGSYSEVPRTDVDSPSSPRPDTPPTVGTPTATDSPKRATKFTEAWYASESLINRTQKRQRTMNAMERATELANERAAERAAAQRNKAYEALNQRYNEEDSDSDRENPMEPDYMSDLEDDHGASGTENLRPDPLRLSNPRYSQGTFSESSNNRLSVGTEDHRGSPSPSRKSALLEAWGRGRTPKPARNFSIQRDDEFFSKPYGELRSGTPPIMYDGDGKVIKNIAARQVSTGNDFDMGSGATHGYRRKASGRAAEEGMAGPSSRYDPSSKYDLTDED